MTAAEIRRGEQCDAMGGAETEVLAERTGLEPATPGVTGRYSNQLNYRSLLNCAYWWVL
jgi:hypothetical protein